MSDKIFFLVRENYDRWSKPLNQLLSICETQEEELPKIKPVKNYILWLGNSLSSGRLPKIPVDINSGFPYMQNIIELSVAKKTNCQIDQKELFEIVEKIVEKLRNCTKNDFKQLESEGKNLTELLKKEVDQVKKFESSLILTYYDFPKLFSIDAKAVKEKNSSTLGIELVIEGFTTSFSLFQKTIIGLDYEVPLLGRVFDKKGLPNEKVADDLRAVFSLESQNVFKYLELIKRVDVDSVVQTFLGPFYFKGSQIKTFGKQDFLIQEIVNLNPESAALCLHRDETKKDFSLGQKKVFTAKSFSFICTKNIYECLRKILPEECQVFCEGKNEL